MEVVLIGACVLLVQVFIQGGFALWLKSQITHSFDKKKVHYEHVLTERIKIYRGILQHIHNIDHVVLGLINREPNVDIEQLKDSFQATFGYIIPNQPFISEKVSSTALETLNKMFEEIQNMEKTGEYDHIKIDKLDQLIVEVMRKDLLKG